MSFLQKHKTTVALNFSAVIIFCSLAVLRSVGVSPFDTEVFSFTRGLDTVTLTRIMVSISTVLNPWLLTAVFVVFAGVLFYKKKISWALFFLLSMLCAVTSALVLKDFFQIARPVDQIVPEIGWGFPSAHATAAAVFFFALFYTIEEKVADTAIVWLWGIVSVGLVLATGFSRVYLGVHFVTDVLAGFALGIFWVTLGILGLRASVEQLHQ